MVLTCTADPAKAESTVASGFMLRFDSSEEHPGNMRGLEIVPQSSRSFEADKGARAHTNIRILVPASGLGSKPVSTEKASENLRNFLGSPMGTQQLDPAINTPSSLACVYQLVAQPGNQPAGCNPNFTSVNPSGGGGAIALVDAYDYTTAAQDLAFFSNYFHLPAADFQTIYASSTYPYISGSEPTVDSGWNLEEALDIEWAHAMAPSAKIFLVEAQDNSWSSLFDAVLAAQYLVSTNGGGEISMSFGGPDFSGESSSDATFASAPSNVIQLAASGDTGSVVLYPSSSPNVIAVGGTAINRDANGSFTSETSWIDSGGGISANEARPSFQNVPSVQSIVGNNRGTPDISSLADPSTGVSVYLAGNWTIVGGTSLATPLTAGIFNVAAAASGTFPDQQSVLQTIYTAGPAATAFRDITNGSCGANSSASGYDLCTGWGSTLEYLNITPACNPLTTRRIAEGFSISNYCGVPPTKARMSSLSGGFSEYGGGDIGRGLAQSFGNSKFSH